MPLNAQDCRGRQGGGQNREIGKQFWKVPKQLYALGLNKSSGK
jgi:hypothetical protein